MKRLLLFFMFIVLIFSCKKDNINNDNTDDNPWSELQDLKPGEVHFDGDYFCYYDCFNDVILCGQRTICDCDVSQFHTDYLTYDCFFITEFNGGNSSQQFEEGDEFGNYFTVCFCGRYQNEYSGTYSISSVIQNCNHIYDVSPREVNGHIVWDGECNDDCNSCVTHCLNKDCGPNGCGGSCGVCPEGKKCSVSGLCINNSSDDPCTNCLSTCHGLPGCCTGCGCLCEDDCGGCF